MMEVSGSESEEDEEDEEDGGNGTANDEEEEEEDDGDDEDDGNVISSLWYYTAAADLGYEVAQANAAHLFETIKDNDKNKLGIQYLKQATKDSLDSKELPKELSKSSSSRSRTSTRVPLYL